MDENKDKPRRSPFSSLNVRRPEQAEEKVEQEKASPELAPAMPELGTAPCPVCGQRVAVFVTRTKRPFINCGFCSARIFYNGSRSMQLLKKQIEADETIGSKAAKVLKTITGGKHD